jgi:hypothetical protein
VRDWYGLQAPAHGFLAQPAVFTEDCRRKRCEERFTLRTGEWEVLWFELFSGGPRTRYGRVMGYASDTPQGLPTWLWQHIGTDDRDISLENAA